MVANLKNLSPPKFFKLETSNFQEMFLKWFKSIWVLEFLKNKNFRPKIQKKSYLLKKRGTFSQNKKISYTQII